MSLLLDLERSVLADEHAGATAARRIGEQFGLRGSEEFWPGVGLLWSFTFTGGGPAMGATFYVRPGATRDEVERVWNKKREEFERKL